MLHALVFTQNYFVNVKERFMREDRGATAVEYGLMVGLIAVAIIATLVLLGPRLAALFNDVLTKMPAGTPVTTTP